jgi:hypothetical protein
VTVIEYEYLEFGFSGSREEPTKEQKKWLLSEVITLVQENDFDRAHHGCCIGSDTFFHKCLKSVMHLGLKQIVLHPPSDRSREMDYEEWELDNCLWYPRKPYLSRNRDIAHRSHILLATPSVPEKSRGSGIWHTIHAAQAERKLVKICHPDGTPEIRLPKK